MKHSHYKTQFFPIIPLLLLGMLLAGCGAGETSRARDGDTGTIALAPAEGLPDYVQDAPPQVQEAYRFALANPEVLAQIPCYCGCNTQGHMNNLDCYVVPNTDGEYEPHAAY
jgi:hypothetical protein